MLPGSFPQRQNPQQEEQEHQRHQGSQRGSSRVSLSYGQKMLQKRRKLCVADVCENLDILLTVFVFVQFLKDTSISKLSARAVVQLGFILSSTGQNQYSMGTIRQVFVMAVLPCTLYCLIYTGLVDLPSHNLDGYLIGEYTIQPIGELIPRSKAELFVYDGIVFCLQVVLTACLATQAVESGGESGEQQRLLSSGDGFQGDFVALKISMRALFDNIL